jgi:uncharacterized protein (TIGR02186 family)
VKRLLALASLLMLTGARDPILVPEVSQHTVEVRRGFTGTELLLFGAILNPEGTRAGRDYDIAVVLKGPIQSILVREKQKIAGMWINADSTGFRSAPLFYAVASSRPIPQIVDEKTAAIYELGLPSLQLSPIGGIEPEEQARFATGLVELNRRGQLYQELDSGVKINEQVLYQARISMPSSVPTGRYTAETFAIRGGRVVASAIAPVEVKKLGVEGAIVRFADEQSFWYGLMTVCVSVLMGWIAGRLFALV